MGAGEAVTHGELKIKLSHVCGVGLGPGDFPAPHTWLKRYGDAHRGLRLRLHPRLFSFAAHAAEQQENYLT